MENQTNILIYQTEDGNTRIDVKLENGTVWMSQKAIAELYQTSSQNITIHIKKYMRKTNCLYIQLVRNTYKFKLRGQEKLNAE